MKLNWGKKNHQHHRQQQQQQQKQYRKSFQWITKYYLQNDICPMLTFFVLCRSQLQSRKEPGDWKENEFLINNKREIQTTRI